MQATEALKLALGIGEPLVGKYFIYNALRGYSHQVAVDKNPDCPLCSERATIKNLSAVIDRLHV